MQPNSCDICRVVLIILAMTYTLGHLHTIRVKLKCVMCSQSYFLYIAFLPITLSHTSNNI